MSHPDPLFDPENVYPEDIIDTLTEDKRREEADDMKEDMENEALEETDLI